MLAMAMTNSVDEPVQAAHRYSAASTPDGLAGRASAAGLHTHPIGSEGRGEVEAFIRTVYLDRFHAQVQAFAPMLVSLRDADGRVLAAAGYRAASEQPLFLERYLTQPVEHRLAQRSANGQTSLPPRAQIVEVGHLAAQQAGEGRRLIVLLGPHLAEAGFQWVVSTLTQELRRLFVRLGVIPLALGVADPALLGEDAAHWGGYYDHHPVVLAGQIGAALTALSKPRARP